MVPLDFYWNKSNLNTPWELNTCVYMWVIYCDSIRMILQILYPSTVWGYNAWYLSRAHRCLLAPLSSIPQRSPWTERSWWDLWHDVQKPCYFIMAAPRISKKRPVHHRGSYLKKHKNSEMDGTKEEVLSSFDKEEEFRWQIRRWPHRSIWQSHATCPRNLGHLPSQQDAPPSPYSATSHSSRTLKKKPQQRETSVPEISHECIHIIWEDSAVTSKGWYMEQEVYLYDTEGTRAPANYRDDRAA